MAERALRSAARRRERWLRSVWRHELLSVRVAVATATHHSWKSHAVVGRQTEPAATSAAPAPVVEYIAPGPIFCAAPAPVIEHVAPVPVVKYTAPAPVVYAAPGPVTEYILHAMQPFHRS